MKKAKKFNVLLKISIKILKSFLKKSYAILVFLEHWNARATGNTIMDLYAFLSLMAYQKDF